MKCVILHNQKCRKKNQTAVTTIELSRSILYMLDILPLITYRVNDTVGNEHLHTINVQARCTQYVPGPRGQRKAKEAQLSVSVCSCSLQKQNIPVSLAAALTDRQTHAPAYADSGQHAFSKKRKLICCDRVNSDRLYLFISSRVVEFSCSSKFTCVLFFSSSSCGTHQVSCLCLCPRVLSSSSTLTRLSRSSQSQYKLFFFSSKDLSSPKDVLLPAGSAVPGHGSKAGHFTRLSSAD